MKYTVDAAVAEVAARSSGLRKRRKKSTVQALSVSCLVLTVLLARMMTALSLTMSAQVPVGAYGSLLFGETIGGYVLVAVVAFAVAVAVTLSLIRHRGNKQGK